MFQDKGFVTVSCQLCIMDEVVYHAQIKNVVFVLFFNRVRVSCRCGLLQTIVTVAEMLLQY